MGKGSGAKMQIHVIRKRKKTTLEVKSSSTIEDVQKLIKKKMDVPKSSQILLWEKDNKEIVDIFKTILLEGEDIGGTRTLKEWGMENNEIFDLPPLRIHVKHVKWNEGNIISIDHDIQRNSKIQDLKKIIKDKTNIPVRDQRLVYNGKVMNDDNSTLANYCVGHEDTLIIDDAVAINVTHKQTGKAILQLPSVAPTDTIYELKRQIQDVVHVLVDDQKLFYNGKELTDKECTIRECDIVDNSTLELNNEIHGMEVQIRLPTSEKFTISNLNMSETLGDLKFKIQEIQTIPADVQYLDLMGNPLSDNSRTLMDYGIKNKDIVDLTPHREKLTPPGDMVLHIQEEKNKVMEVLGDLHVHPKDSIATVKKFIQNEYHILTFMQKLSYKGTLLADDRPTLHYLEIKDGETLELVVLPMELKVRTNQKQDKSFIENNDTEIFIVPNLDRWDTIENVKKKIEQVRGVPVDNQDSLSYKGKVLSDLKPTLFDLRILHGDILDLMFEEEKEDKKEDDEKEEEPTNPVASQMDDKTAKKTRNKFKYNPYETPPYSSRITKTESGRNVDLGIKFTKDPEDGNFYVLEISQYLQENTSARVHDRLINCQGKDANKYKSVDEINQAMKECMTFSLQTLRPTVKDENDGEEEEDDDDDYDDDGVKIQAGDIVRLIKSGPDLDGVRVELKKKAPDKKWMVSQLKTGKVMLVSREQLDV